MRARRAATSSPSWPRRSQDPRCRKEARNQGQRRAQEARDMAPMSAEATVVRNYLDVLLGLPWGKKSQAQEGHRRGAGGARRGPLRARQGQGPDRRISRGPGAHQQAQGADPVPRRPARRRQDLPRPVDRPRDRPRVRAPVAGRRARRGRDPRPPPHLHRLAAGQDRHQPEEGRHVATRCSCSTRSTSSARISAAIRPRRCSRCSIPSRTAGSRTIISSSTSTFRDVMFVTHRELAQPAAAAARPHGDHPARGLHRGREGRDRQAPPDPEADRGARPQGRRVQLHRRGPARPDPLLHPRGRRAHARARDRPRWRARRCARSSRGKAETVDVTRRESRRIPGRAQVPPRRRRGRGPDRRGHRPRLDRGRRRTADDRGGHRAGQGRRSRPPASSAT